MNETVALTLLSGCVTIMTAIMLAAIPWAFNVHGTLSELKKFMRDNQNLRDRVIRLESKVGISYDD